MIKVFIGDSQYLQITGGQLMELHKMWLPEWNLNPREK